MTTAAATKTDAPVPEMIPMPIARERLEEEVPGSIGLVSRITLPDDATIDEGYQSNHVWSVIGTELSRGEWLEIENDAGSFWCLARVSELHGSKMSGLRGLCLRFIVPPQRSNVKFEQPVATGNWYCRHMGGFQKWCVISPAGTVFKSGFTTETEAQSHVFGRQSSSRPL
jgi:hypothetical protein